ncbi:MAG: nucleotide exchange factor GrpE [Alphaproteobacteria bacterium]|nr:nucleotide exchange factor GrpE [Alphaproteobacteria bacterium]
MENTMNEDKEVAVESVSVEDATTSETVSGDINPELESLNTKLAEMNDKYLRMAAELENTRRRAALDAESRARNRAISVAEKILPVMDAVDAALKLSPDDAGIKSMSMALESAFEQIGITRIKSVGEPLNPALHNAIQAIDAPCDGESRPAPNTIIQEMQCGYMMGDTVLRTAMVVVCK